MVITMPGGSSEHCATLPLAFVRSRLRSCCRTAIRALQLRNLLVQLGDLCLQALKLSKIAVEVIPAQNLEGREHGIDRWSNLFAQPIEGRGREHGAKDVEHSTDKVLQ